MKDQLETLKLFARVARVRSFSKVARERGRSQSSVSRSIAALEESVGASLLARTTRTVVLTEAGSDYLARIEPLLVGLDEANQAARGTGELRGVLRVALPFSFGLREVIPELPAFLDAHPALRLELVLDDQRKDLLREGVDIALRVGTLSDSTATTRLLGENPRVLVAAPRYLERAGSPTDPDDLRRHHVIVGPAGDTGDAWTFERGGKTVSVRVQGRIVVNANEGAVRAAVAGLGLLSSGLRGCRAELANGSLVRVLSAWRMSSAPLHAVLPAGKAAKPSARAFVSFLAHVFSAESSVRLSRSDTPRPSAKSGGRTAKRAGSGRST